VVFVLVAACRLRVLVRSRDCLCETASEKRHEVPWWKTALKERYAKSQHLRVPDGCRRVPECSSGSNAAGRRSKACELTAGRRLRAAPHATFSARSRTRLGDKDTPQAWEVASKSPLLAPADRAASMSSNTPRRQSNSARGTR
jgi:hypothetical protein